MFGYYCCAWSPCLSDYCLGEMKMGVFFSLLLRFAWNIPKCNYFQSLIAGFKVRAGVCPECRHPQVSWTCPSVSDGRSLNRSTMPKGSDQRHIENTELLCQHFCQSTKSHFRTIYSDFCVFWSYEIVKYDWFFCYLKVICQNVLYVTVKITFADSVSYAQFLKVLYIYTVSHNQNVHLCSIAVFQSITMFNNV